ncbi:hypothetical protein [Massilia glaciei]|uniref:hypothetical protein n=1 Tax=Massilia glaciei TaxID=1524097 RepID=UPI0015E80DF0|nr:hypothetical protein [Massilia glaciei]
MPVFTHPTKDQVRAYLLRRSRDAAPPPSPKDIRRELGWAIASSKSKSLPVPA